MVDASELRRFDGAARAGRRGRRPHATGARDRRRIARHVSVALGIAGAGLIGGSIALRAAQLGWTVGVYDVDAGHAAYARERCGASFATQSLAELVARSRAVVLAAPLAATLAQIAELERD
ncbi:MAG: NAD(P)-binding domain-containing protein, partial [Candidatus Eremiobacteraeota bacterium]|nr:NAD(P)-binding domain-containing protein [Candidatus Eremiobacteraeota bacterium]